MNPAKVKRENVKLLTDLPNIGRAMADNLRVIGINRPDQLKGKSPYDLYDELCTRTGMKHDPCVLDVFISIARFIEGDAPRPWWDYTEERKKAIGRINA